jgi:hypothetical protein
MSMPVMKLSQQAVALRIRENEWDALERDLDDLVLNHDYPLEVPKILKCLQASLTNRLGFLPLESSEHKDIQRDVDALEVLINHINMRHEA